MSEEGYYYMDEDGEIGVIPKEEAEKILGMARCGKSKVIIKNHDTINGGKT